EFRFIIEMTTKTDEYARPATPPDTSSLTEVLAASRECTACHLYKRATQTVFGEGHRGAPIMLVGEQRGDYEDVAGKPCVGLAAKCCRRSLRHEFLPRFTHLLCFDSRTKNPGNANTNGLSLIFGLP